MGDLIPLTGEIKTKKFIVLDLESKSEDSDIAGFDRPFMAGIFDGARYTAFWDTNPTTKANWRDNFWDIGGCIDLLMTTILTRKYRGYHIYAHNAGRFDYLFLLPWLMRRGIELGFAFSIVPVSSSIQVLDVWKVGSSPKKHRCWRFLDSFRLVPTSLNKAAASFGLGSKTEHDLNTSEHDRKSWNLYNKQDCVLNYQVVDKFHHYVENVLLGEVGITAPSTAIKLFRRQFLKRPVPRSEASHEFIRAGYCGGRVEKFIDSGDKLFVYDFNSSYPASMKELMPIGEGVHWKGTPPPRFSNNDKFVGFVKCDIFVPEMNIPPLPVFGSKEHGINDRLIFPTGKLSGTWEWGELQQAISMGCIIDNFHESWWYESGYLFKDFVDTLYSYRDTSRPDYSPGLDAIAKLLLNSTYGKFAMKTLRKKIYLYSDPAMPANATAAYPDPECLIYYAEEESDAPYVMPQISARITALSRTKLLRAMIDAERAGGKVYYTDTDSIVTDVEMPSSSALGALKIVYPDHAGNMSGKFIGPKLYVLEASNFLEVKAKGFQLPRLNKTENLSSYHEKLRATVDTILSGGTVFSSRLEKVGSMARRNFNGGPRMLNIPRTNKSAIGKRRSLPNGDSEPYNVTMY